jgi:hypothetical protein
MRKATDPKTPAAVFVASAVTRFSAVTKRRRAQPLAKSRKLSTVGDKIRKGGWNVDKRF